MAGIDLNRTSDGVLLPVAVSNEIWTHAVEDSVVMQAARRVPSLPGGGVAVPITEDDGEADWVDETDEKPVSNLSLASKTMKGYTIARILTFSNQFRRDLPALYNELIPAAAKSLGKAFDRTVFGYKTAPGDKFDTLASAPTQTISSAGDVYANLLAAVGASVAAGGDPDTLITSTQGDLLLLGEVDANGRPLFVSTTTESNLAAVTSVPGIGRVLRSRNVYRNPASGADVVGILGPWASGAAWGQAQAISFRINTEGSVTVDGEQVNLWQRNMFAVLLEAELGFRARDAAQFIKLTGGTTTGGS